MAEIVVRLRLQIVTLFLFVFPDWRHERWLSCFPSHVELRVELCVVQSAVLIRCMLSCVHPPLVCYAEQEHKS
eukprot:m.48384 g.48384  ORF g.48384 m.48384 type:complete len:73 (+) comp12394_c1_seq3:69-287(+)